MSFNNACQSYLKAIDLQIRAAADADTAVKMAAYMKNNFPFLGVMAEKRKQISNAVLKENPLHPDEKRMVVSQLWLLSEREFHQLAIDLLATIKTKDLKESDLEFAEYLILTHSWWDSVDTLASNFVGRLLSRFPEKRDQLIESWLNSGNLWLRRTTLIFQLKYNNKTDFKLLCYLIDQMHGDRAFFIQKAIGWSLRQFSKTEPQAVREFINNSRLTGLALREASKYC